MPFPSPVASSSSAFILLVPNRIMFRATTLLVVLGWAMSVSAFSNPALVRPITTISSTTALTSSVNEYIGQVKMDYSGPNLMVGMPDIGPSSLARASSTDTINVEDLIEMQDEESYKGYAEVPASTNKIKRSGRWITAVFWSDLNLYGNILS